MSRNQSDFPIPRPFSMPEAHPTSGLTGYGLQAHSKGLRDYLIPFFRYKYRVLLVFFLVTTFSGIAIFAYFRFIARPVFESRSQLLVKSGWENITPDLGLGGNRLPTFSLSDILNSEVRILRSRELKERVIRTVGLENLYPEIVRKPPQGISPVEAAIIAFDEHMEVRPAAKGNIIEVSYKNGNASSSSKALNNLIAFYMEKRIDAYKDPKSAIFLEKKVEEYRQKYLEAENRLKTLQQESRVVSYEDQRTLLLNQRMTLDVSLKTTYNQIKEGRQKLTELEKQLKSIPKNIITPATRERMGELEGRLLALQLQEKELLAKYKEDNRLVANVRSQMEMVMQFMEKQKGKSATPDLATPDPIYQDIQRQMLQTQAELSALEVRGSELERQLREVDADLQGLDAQGFKFKALSRELANAEERLRVYQQKLEEARILDDLERQKMTSVTVIEPAAVPVLPVNRPKPIPVYMAIALLLGLGASIGYALMLDFMDQGMATPQEAERRTGIPVLAVIAEKK